MAIDQRKERGFYDFLKKMNRGQSSYFNVAVFDFNCLQYYYGCQKKRNLRRVEDLRELDIQKLIRFSVKGSEVPTYALILLPHTFDFSEKKEVMDWFKKNNCFSYFTINSDENKIAHYLIASKLLEITPGVLAIGRMGLDGASLIWDMIEINETYPESKIKLNIIHILEHGESSSYSKYFENSIQKLQNIFGEEFPLEIEVLGMNREVAEQDDTIKSGQR